jgi:hypothetical protein
MPSVNQILYKALRSKNQPFLPSASLYEPGYRYEIKKDYKVTNPRELIHQYATTTPVTTIDPTLSETTRTITRQHYTQTVEESLSFWDKSRLTHQ